MTRKLRLQPDEIVVKSADHYYYRPSIMYGGTTWKSRAEEIDRQRLRAATILEGLLELFPDLDRLRHDKAQNWGGFKRDWDDAKIARLAAIQAAETKSKADAAELAKFKASK